MSECSNVADEVMPRMCNRTPVGFQLDIISGIVQMTSHMMSLEPILTIHPTGSGKSIIPLNATELNGGITIIIKNTLSLGADQSTKVN